MCLARLDAGTAFEVLCQMETYVAKLSARQAIDVQGEIIDEGTP